MFCALIFILIVTKKIFIICYYVVLQIRTLVSTYSIDTKSENQPLYNWETHVVTRPRAVEMGKAEEVEKDERRSRERSVAGAYSLYTSTGQQIPGLRRMCARSRTWPTRTKPINFPFNSLDPSSAPSRLPIIVLQNAQRLTDSSVLRELCSLRVLRFRWRNLLWFMLYSIALSLCVAWHRWQTQSFYNVTLTIIVFF